MPKRYLLALAPVVSALLIAVPVSARAPAADPSSPPATAHAASAACPLDNLPSTTPEANSLGTKPFYRVAANTGSTSLACASTNAVIPANEQQKQCPITTLEITCNASWIMSVGRASSIYRFLAEVNGALVPLAKNLIVYCRVAKIACSINTVGYPGLGGISENISTAGPNIRKFEVF